MVPNLTLFQVFRQFLGFGLRAWGGAFPQIQMLKEELVIRDDWITLETFNRVFAVYQVLPGPEAAELCMYFGFLARNRPGAFVAGIGFLLPGFVSIMFFSWIYTLIGTTNIYFNASFKALQPLVAAMVNSASPSSFVPSTKLQSIQSTTEKLESFIPFCSSYPS
jgi:chromate transport protein ChrA